MHRVPVSPRRRAVQVSLRQLRSRSGRLLILPGRGRGGAAARDRNGAEAPAPASPARTVAVRMGHWWLPDVGPSLNGRGITARDAMSPVETDAPRVRTLDGMRGLAVVAVVAFHMDRLSGGWL